MTIKQLSVFLENKPGQLVEALETLANADIDLRALSLADTADFGILRVIVPNPDHAFNVLKEVGYIVMINEVIPVAVGDKPGSLAAVLRILADRDIDVEYTYAFVSHSKDRAFVILRIASENEFAIKILKENNVTLITEADLFEK
ncbi:MAG: hypothetical protein LBC73_00600 [Oscillospiraceae bacterium]|jgi:hypothetical protein|nr:hypothetical protein [Oscillospiraceae bacterium]